MAVRGDFELNSVGYYGTVGEVTLDTFGDVIQQGGGATEKAIVRQERRTLLPPIWGFGRNRTPSDKHDDPQELRRFYDSTCETRWPSDFRLGILNEAATITGLEVARVSAHFKGDIWMLWDDDTGTDVVARDFTGSTTTWGGGGTVDVGGGGTSPLTYLPTRPT